ncbi:hypothetical protein DFQ26_008156 [Actinomortierella ambigua]|nr:hypothetical protein DFQ26_008156 [Actinomortierella ambigua]
MLSKAVIRYEVHPTPEEPEICCYRRLSAWLKFYQSYYMNCVKRPVAAEDPIFPTIDRQGRFNVTQEHTPQTIQKWLTYFATKSGILDNKPGGNFTTHCFRRGGAQHRFMFTKEKWSLKAVRWWGGWSEKEDVGVITRYLLDEMHHYESGYSDIMSPDRRAHRQTLFMGAEDADKPPTVAHIHEQNKSIVQMSRTLAQLTEAVAQMQAQLHHIASSLQATHGQQIPGTTPAPAVPSTPPFAAGQMAPPFSFGSSQPFGLSGTQSLDMPNAGSSVAIPAFPQNVAYQQRQREAVDQRHHMLLEQAVSKPKIPSAKTWKEVYEQWANGDPSKGLTIPLKDWTTAMRGRANSSLYAQRKIIAMEYERCGYNEQEFTRLYSATIHNLKALILAIRQKRKERRVAERVAMRRLNRESSASTMASEDTFDVSDEDMDL